MPKSKKAEEAMTTQDYSSLAQSHVILATQRFDKIGDRINSLQAFASVPKVGYDTFRGRLGSLRGVESRFHALRCVGGGGVAQAHAPYTLDPAHVTHTNLNGEQAARKRDRERAKRDISAFNQARTQGGVKGAIATSRWERSSKKFAWNSKVAISESEDDTGDAESKDDQRDPRRMPRVGTTARVRVGPSQRRVSWPRARRRDRCREHWARDLEPQPAISPPICGKIKSRNSNSSVRKLNRFRIARHTSEVPARY